MTCPKDRTCQTTTTAPPSTTTAPPTTTTEESTTTTSTAATTTTAAESTTTVEVSTTPPPVDTLPPTGLGGHTPDAVLLAVALLLAGGPLAAIARYRKAHR